MQDHFAQEEGGAPGQTMLGIADGAKLFDRFRLQKVLGRGSLGIVWLAFDEQMEGLVALKLISEPGRFDPGAAEDWKREARRGLLLTHPNIARIFDLIEDEHVAAIAMEHVDGLTLAVLRAHRRAKCFGVLEITPWVTALCDALSYAHDSAGVIHRDLKPSNLIVNSRSQLKVTDFGIPGVPGLSHGAFHYASPQQLRGEKPSPSDDIYSLGATLYELLSSKPPFHGGELASPTLTERRLRSGITGEAIPPHWETTIAACLEKDPARRPRSAGEIARRLHLHGTIQLTTAREISLPSLPSLPRFARRRLAALAGGILLLLAAGYFALRPLYRHETGRLVLPAGYARETHSSILVPSPASEPKNGVLQVKTNPAGANFAIYPGVITGKTPPAAAPLHARTAPDVVEELASGRYTVFFRLEGWPEERAEVSLAPGERLPIEYIFPHGRASITSTPDGAEIFSGDRSLGKTPLTIELPLGRQELRARYPDRPERKQTVMIERDVSVEMIFLMRESTPSKARVKSKASESVVDKIGQTFRNVFSRKPSEKEKKKRSNSP